MNDSYDTRKAAEEIVQVLHDNKVPIGMADAVFRWAKDMMEAYSVPYNPRALNTKAPATLETTGNATDPSG